MKQTLLIAFSTQKGGVGKTTFTTLAASYLHYMQGYNVAVMDCDYPQWSVHSLRKREAEQLQSNGFYQKKALAMFEALGKGTYPVICTRPDNDVLTRAKEFLASEQTDYDVLLFDLPGTINNEGVINTFLGMDYVFVPVSASRLSMESTLPFIISVNEMKAAYPQINLKSIHLFWNMVVPGSRRELYVYYEKLVERFGIPLLRTSIPRSLRYDREQSIEGNALVFLSTILSRGAATDIYRRKAAGTGSPTASRSGASPPETQGTAGGYTETYFRRLQSLGNRCTSPGQRTKN